jgi:hypothetical protein
MPKELAFLVALFILIGIVHFIAGRMYERNKIADPQPPLTEEALKEFDDLPSGVAVTLAWTDGTNQQEVRDTMPVLGRALDRMINVNFSEREK